jgi:hypothetical protein
LNFLKKKEEKRTLITRLLETRKRLFTQKQEIIDKEIFHKSFLWDDGFEKIFKLYFDELNKIVNATTTHPINYTEATIEAILEEAISNSGNSIYPDGQLSNEMNEASPYLNLNGLSLTTDEGMLQDIQNFIDLIGVDSTSIDDISNGGYTQIEAEDARYIIVNSRTEDTILNKRTRNTDNTIFSYESNKYAYYLGKSPYNLNVDYVNSTETFSLSWSNPNVSNLSLIENKIYYSVDGGVEEEFVGTIDNLDTEIYITGISSLDVDVVFYITCSYDNGIESTRSSITIHVNDNDSYNDCYSISANNKLYIFCKSYSDNCYIDGTLNNDYFAEVSGTNGTSQEVLIEYKNSTNIIVRTEKIINTPENNVILDNENYYDVNDFSYLQTAITDIEFCKDLVEQVNAIIPTMNIDNLSFTDNFLYGDISGETSSVLPEETLNSYNNYFTTSVGNEIDYELNLNNMKTYFSTLITTLIDRSNYVKDDILDAEFKVWRNFWYYERIGKPLGSLIQYKAILEMIDKNETEINKENSQFEKVFSSEPFKFKTPKSVALFYLNDFDTNGDVVNYKTKFIWDGSIIASKYKIYKKPLRLVVDNEEWTEDYLINDITITKQNGDISNSMIDDIDFVYEEPYVYRVKTIDEYDASKPYSILNETLESKQNDIFSSSISVNKIDENTFSVNIEDAIIEQGSNLYINNKLVNVLNKKEELENGIVKYELASDISEAYDEVRLLFGVLF